MNLTTSHDTAPIAVYPDLRGKVVVVTGAGGGIGTAAVDAFAQQGAVVIGLDLAAGQTQPQRPDVHHMTVDIADTDQIADAVDRIADDHGKIDAWINNAGFMARMPAFDMDLESWNKTIAINLTGTFFGAQAAARVMVDNGGGSIVNLSSYAALKARPNCTDYAAAKAAVVHLTSCLALEWGPLGIRVNAIAPGYIRTPMSSWMHADPVNYESYVGKTPLRRMGEPAEIAQMMLHLSSDTSSYVTGQTFLVDGGVTKA
ncbi:NAD(P)-dependent dehydrogenase (short-subunit alcohol dehydrogenase family) [Rhodococcus sp. AG1013]|uniref:SDR family NAD(P)-dependent oxidoreductase n=1 Tax=Rhodococcus sp. AG1013 TaxID=2183996 RepID=UPI000E0B7FA6|nr:SDR family oxidoreductase [Rhodococcus sp. AG1013]RDI28167.1 NAD(P)-dependent dehydrogenase (short-subunit alcohol dehydrogenase family) [Rhodococcus sp. AG1013]